MDACQSNVFDVRVCCCHPHRTDDDADLTETNAHLQHREPWLSSATQSRANVPRQLQQASALLALLQRHHGSETIKQGRACGGGGGGGRREEHAGVASGQGLRRGLPRLTLHKGDGNGRFVLGA